MISGAKFRACAELIRIDLAFGAGFFVVAGEILALGKLPPSGLILTGFSALFFISGSANISNDFFDREVDRVNLPSRPLPSGRITVGELRAFFIFCTLAGLTAAALAGPALLGLAILLWGISLLYNMKIKEYGPAGNLVVAACVGATILAGGIAAGVVNGLVLCFAALAFLFDLGEEIAADAMDVRGDSVRSSRSLAHSRGTGFAVRTAAAILCIVIILMMLPVAAGWIGYRYLIPAAAAGSAMLWCIAGLVRNPEPQNGRIRIRQLYLLWGVFVIAVTMLVIL